MSMSEARETNARAIAAYKALLREALDKRPSGTRLKLAEALGTNRSFVSQITNPSYLIPIPAQHLDLIFEVCHLAPAERAAFLKAYHSAHPGRAEQTARQQQRNLTIGLPDFGDDRRNRLLDRAIQEFAHRLVRYTQEVEACDRHARNTNAD